MLELPIVIFQPVVARASQVVASCTGWARTPSMAVTSMHLDHPIDEVFALVSDPWRFADWVVGASCIRAVDPTWPAAGSRFHHRFGIGPFTIDDSTVLEEIAPPHHLVLRARARPTGVARVRLDFRATPDGGTDVAMEEYPTGGFACRVRNPLLDAIVVARNRRCLLRVDKLLTEERSSA